MGYPPKTRIIIVLMKVLKITILVGKIFFLE